MRASILLSALSVLVLAVSGAPIDSDASALQARQGVARRLEARQTDGNDGTGILFTGHVHEGAQNKARDGGLLALRSREGVLNARQGLFTDHVHEEAAT
ncbi:hypothetical protein FA95DRAFT_1563383 [Auriscalpium vulgare]|uniref:Uncharacterized protein n=1 Tax=Auriscalpium vulgare TaxID=40419 RepID=A0ACB8RHA8_9AGAM|nr:hypothetical protein FA95DRAFT_1563383 [Auriscalpium vulgare]